MAAETSVNPIVMLIPYVLSFAIFYFLVLRPQKQKQNEFQKMIDNLKKNDEVVTNGGIHGTIVNIKDKTITLRVDDNVKIEIDRAAVARVEKGIE
ncbi:MAG: preprotein translocase subunit YajC [Candidatus Omnitrophica bacterium]|nr:preprotein translocase subunit YajC [Candidatus Omnitrophota bacterium]